MGLHSVSALTGVSHEVVAHSSAFVHRLAGYIGQSTCTSRDGVIHDRLQGEHWLVGEVSHFKPGAFDLIDWYRIRNRHGQATVPKTLFSVLWILIIGTQILPCSLTLGPSSKSCWVPFPLMVLVTSLSPRPGLTCWGSKGVGVLTCLAPSCTRATTTQSRNYQPCYCVRSGVASCNSSTDQWVGRWSPTSSVCMRDHVSGMKSPSLKMERRSSRTLR